MEYLGMALFKVYYIIRIYYHLAKICGRFVRFLTFTEETACSEYYLLSERQSSSVLIDLLVDSCTLRCLRILRPFYYLCHLLQKNK